MNAAYYPLGFVDESPDITLFRTVAANIFDASFGKKHSVSQWIRMGNITFKGKDFRKNDTSGTASLTRLVRYLQEKRRFDHQEAGIPEIPVSWMDRGIPVKSQLHFHGEHEAEAVTLQLSSKNFIEYPVYPTLDREGMVFSAMMNTLEAILLSARSDLVLSSNRMFSGTDTYWIEKLMVYLNTSISLIDSMLIMLYYKAKFDGRQMGWTFDEEALGPTYTPRMCYKFNWIYKITGKESYITGAEMAAFNELKVVHPTTS